MYASEVAIYKALTAELEKDGLFAPSSRDATLPCMVQR